MSSYIVFDLEWNQSVGGKADTIEDFPFEIIEIGAVKLDEQFHMTDQFHRLIYPRVYREMHYAISEVTHMSMSSLRKHGERFERAAEEFFAWCGEDAVYCTWGSMDLTELQRNMKFFHMENPLPKPLFYYDIQKLYGLLYQDKAKVSLDTAAEQLEIKEDRPFHRALDDAYYTGRIFAVMSEQKPGEQFLPYWSVDYYRLPETKKEELHLVFPDYSKYVSRLFPSREDALKERAVTEMRCYVCKKVLRKKVRWFSSNQKIYYALAICPQHGYLKGKLRMKHIGDTGFFAVRTLKLTDEENAEQIRSRRMEVSKKKAKRNREKRKREREQEHGAGENKKKGRKKSAAR